MPRPDLSRVPEWYHVYINQVKENDLIKAIQDQSISFLKFLKRIPVEKRNYRYAKGKWTIKEMLQHIIDAERVFSYRALCFARKESAPLPSFDENEYAANSKAAKRDWNEMLEEFKAVRHSTEIMFGSFDKTQLDSTGTASGKPVYVLGIGFILVGHINHHIRVLTERYL
ncbi:MAG: DinB family protein [Chitinophagaceae bacterium]